MGVQVQEHGHQWKLIGDLMNRLPNSMRNMYFDVCQRTSNGVWLPDEEERLQDAVACVHTWGRVWWWGWGWWGGARGGSPAQLWYRACCWVVRGGYVVMAVAGSVEAGGLG